MYKLYKKLSVNPRILKIYDEIIMDDLAMGLAKIQHLIDDGRAH